MTTNLKVAFAIMILAAVCLVLALRLDPPEAQLFGIAGMILLVVGTFVGVGEVE